MSQALIDTYWARSSALALTSTISMKGENRLEYSAQAATLPQWANLCMTSQTHNPGSMLLLYRGASKPRCSAGRRHLRMCWPSSVERIVNFTTASVPLPAYNKLHLARGQLMVR
ncbi:hypothetical protein [Thermosporothrix hazakensis]|jgi:hypothetical protein|uniref:hypothetical protein n=1 Tax=Thermosporothrix hazakensis TaxID=644383 RepID=UPI000DADD32F|nr:hypothetical protein [Thermosporothrix hazakensis]